MIRTPLRMLSRLPILVACAALSSFSHASPQAGITPGVDDAFETPANPGVDSIGVSDALVTVQGVDDLRAYAAVTQILAQVPGVRRVALEMAGASIASFRVALPGGVDALSAALAGHARLTPSGGNVPGLLALTYRP